VRPSKVVVLEVKRNRRSVILAYPSRVIPNASSSTRRTASYWALALVLGLIALLPSTTEGVAAAYGAFILGFVLTALVAAIAERRWHVAQKDFPVPSLAVAGVVLVIAGAGVPVLEAGAMGRRQWPRTRLSAIRMTRRYGWLSASSTSSANA
jgi:hypothetical protein